MRTTEIETPTPELWGHVLTSEGFGCIHQPDDPAWVCRGDDGEPNGNECWLQVWIDDLEIDLSDSQTAPIEVAATWVGERAAIVGRRPLARPYNEYGTDTD